MHPNVLRGEYNIILGLSGVQCVVVSKYRASLFSFFVVLFTFVGSGGERNGLGVAREELECKEKVARHTKKNRELSTCFKNNSIIIILAKSYIFLTRGYKINRFMGEGMGGQAVSGRVRKLTPDLPKGKKKLKQVLDPAAISQLGEK